MSTYSGVYLPVEFFVLAIGFAVALFAAGIAVIGLLINGAYRRNQLERWRARRQEEAQIYDEAL
jgi:hypothetical protein